MKHYAKEMRELTRWTHSTCDGCGQKGHLTEVTIGVDEGEKGGRLDEYDYCAKCLRDRGDLLVAAGSRAPLLTGVELPPDDDE